MKKILGFLGCMAVVLPALGCSGALSTSPIAVDEGDGHEAEQVSEAEVAQRAVSDASNQASSGEALQSDKNSCLKACNDGAECQEFIQRQKVLMQCQHTRLVPSSCYDPGLENARQACDTCKSACQ